VSYSIVPANLAVKAMRDNGYKNAAYAIAELVDNSVQAKATTVEILCEDEERRARVNVTRQVRKIAIVDNGEGMTKDVLQKALQFGNGSRLDDRSGIGRFGMGLPNSSISQARRVEVWTWQKDINKAYYSYLDLDEIEEGQLSEVPEPIQGVDIPAIWKTRSKILSNSKHGTLVLWTELDKCDWKTAKSIFSNSEFVIGRIYRHFLLSNKLKIRMADFFGNRSSIESTDEFIQPNDPLYLMPNSRLPTPWNSEPMFEKHGEPMILQAHKGTDVFSVKITFSIAKKIARSGYNPGAEKHGKHAANNIGVSIVRAERELELQKGWCLGYDPVERWWGVEVNFPPALDEVFGVTNNKQSARSLEEISHLDLDQIAERNGYESARDMQDAWRMDKDERLILVEVKAAIEKNLSTMRSLIKQMTANSKKGASRYNVGESPELKGTQLTKIRQGEGHKGTSDQSEALPPEQRIDSIQATLAQAGIENESAKDIARNIVVSGTKYEFIAQHLNNTSEFFTVRPNGGTLLIGLNVDHPAYDHLISLMEETPPDEGVNDLRARLSKAYDALKLLIMAWARYEDELPDGRQKELTQDIRSGWGKMAREFLRDE